MALLTLSRRIRNAAAMAFVAALALLSTAHPVSAQLRNVDPNDVIDADLDRPATPTVDTPPAPRAPTTIDDGIPTTSALPGGGSGTAVPTASGDGVVTESAAAAGQTYRRDDLIGAAEGVFGRGAEGLARIIEDILREQGEPNGYIVGREAGGAFVFGLRYGSGTLHHRIEGTQPVYWTGPSIGFDAGANAGNTFVLVYNLHDTADLFHRIPAGEGAAYLVGGFNASYLRRGDIVLIPVRLGVGARLGVNVGYMKFSRRQRWLPF